MKKKFTWKKAIYIILGLLFAVALFSGIGYLVKSNSKESEAFLTRKPSVQNMEDKVMATGKIVPKEEIEIKPNIAGIIDKILVDEGDKVEVGQLIATVRIVPNLSEVNNAQQNVNNQQLQISNAKLNVDNMRKQFEMQERLYKQGVASKQEFLNAQQQLYSTQQALRNAQQQLVTAQKALQIAKTGSTPELQGLATTQIRSKASGTVLEVPVKMGSQVIEANSFNAGTTICSIADLNSLIFQGEIDEAQAGKLKQGMDMNIVIGALQNKTFPGRLTMIAPKGKDNSGTIKFPVEGDVFNPNNEYIRAGFSANGEIVLNSQKNALLLDESLVQYEKKNGKDLPFVEVKQKDGKFKKAYVKLGASDGINVQILSGIDKNADVKVWNPSDKDKEELKEKAKK
ncbi:MULTISPECIES: efflux RND transporter periplasmic adaptor subunit [Chryseobacterium]|jgi:HlyD family secretion protein|uniref:HlyD family secretion protein n=1 Tax=Chryseobacterium gambrini TaxID=373672 RepID=A0A1N7QTJ7_9FLAO|nr:MULTISPECIES: efflux RND transporter periplasmic adaptor subunit [Chryseobacterium]MBL7880751.1 efflux RND transporter periplasmic adaptor subunit [Chryseobacterium gambrini]MCY1663014.1 efflux RND transporter periplasmic adaptor subunit [Chryseobacterium sp. SL1]WBV54233.1 efflux RND transporter periplasmic adaptor subunit [Chryseobacterium gambrini]WBX98625.1 efflux RND transporter periplasmic adaptor subunit [Chryseobacterium gambrini]SIT25807.1 HlyD family secretion protein [Chryseobact